MPRNSKKTNTQTRLQKIGRANLTIVAAFMLVFVGFGSWFVYHSEAATWYCAQHIYYPGESGIYHGYCVYQIQGFLRAFHSSYVGGSVPAPAYDGVYGQQTASDVAAFQNYVNNHAYIYSTLRAQGALPVTGDGVVGRDTWFAICDASGNLWGSGYYYSSMGCGISTRLYGTAYVN